MIPFVTDGGWPGHVIEDIKRECSGAAFKNEMEIRFDSTGGAGLVTPEADIAVWIEHLKTFEKESFYEIGRIGSIPDGGEK